MNELDLLIQQKRELERKIKELKNCAQVVGQVKIDVERYSTSLPDRYFLAVFYKPLQNSRPNEMIAVASFTSLENAAWFKEILEEMFSVEEDK